MVEYVKLGDVCHYDKIVDMNPNLPYIGLENIESNTGRYIKSVEELQAKSNTFHFTEKHLLYGRLRPYLNKVYLPNFEGRCSTEIYPISVTEKLSREYLSYWLRSDNIVKKIDATWKGARMPRANMSEVLTFQIPLPPLSEQQHIVKVLDAVGALIAKRKQQIALLDESVKSRFIELFGDCKTNPKQWKTLRLDEVADVGSSKRVFVEELKSEGIPFYRGTEVGALAEGKTISPEMFITPEHYKELCEATGAPQAGDLLMPSICPDGRIWVVNTDAPFYFKDGRVLWVHNISESLNPVFLLYTLRDRIMTDYLSIASGTTFAELKIFSLKTCQVFDVPIDLQNEFAAFVEQTDKLKLTIQQGIEKLETMKKALMQEYFG